MTARTFAAEAPDDLLDVFRGSAYFLRELAGLTEDGFDAPVTPGRAWTRRHVIAAVSYNARSYAAVAEIARTGVLANAGGFEHQDRDAVIAQEATQPVRALRHLAEHSTVHLRVEWRDLSGGDWDRSVDGLVGGPLTPRSTVARRFRDVWLAGLCLSARPRYDDLPERLLTGTPLDPTEIILSPGSAP